MPKFTIKVDPDLCIGAASCVTIDPTHFQLNAENKAYIPGVPPDDHAYERVVEISDEQKDNLILAAQSCPTLAIFIFDEAGNQIYPA